MEAVITSETSTSFYETTRRYNPPLQRRRENLKSHEEAMVLTYTPWFLIRPFVRSVL
jgi:hypothetical protein